MGTSEAEIGDCTFTFQHIPTSFDKHVKSLMKCLRNGPHLRRIFSSRPATATALPTLHHHGAKETKSNSRTSFQYASSSLAMIDPWQRVYVASLQGTRQPFRSNSNNTLRTLDKNGSLNRPVRN